MRRTMVVSFVVLLSAASPPPDIHAAGCAPPVASRTRAQGPAPLYRDPLHDGAADPTLIWNRDEKCWWMLYTNRRADADNETGVKWVHGTDIGIASTPDGGATWKYRGIARGLEFESGRNTFWAPEVIDFGGKYHAFISYVRGVPETWAGTRDIVHYTSSNLLDWKFEGIVVPGSIDACVHRLPDGRWRMWFKNEQRKIRGTTLDSDDLYAWTATVAEMPDPDPGQGEGPDVIFWKGWFWMVKDMWKGLGYIARPTPTSGNSRASSSTSPADDPATTGWASIQVFSCRTRRRSTWSISSIRRRRSRPIDTLGFRSRSWALTARP